MALTTARGIQYPESVDAVDLAQQHKDLATTADTAVGTVAARADALAAIVPFATGAVTFDVAGTGTTVSQAFTWPSGRFTQPPLCIATNNGGSGSSAFFVQMIADPDVNGGTVLAVNRDGSSATITTMHVQILGMQMTSGSSFG